MHAIIARRRELVIVLNRIPRPGLRGDGRCGIDMVGVVMVTVVMLGLGQMEIGERGDFGNGV